MRGRSVPPPALKKQRPEGTTARIGAAVPLELIATRPCAVSLSRAWTQPCTAQCVALAKEAPLPKGCCEHGRGRVPPLASLAPKKRHPQRTPAHVGAAMSRRSRLSHRRSAAPEGPPRAWARPCVHHAALASGPEELPPPKSRRKRGRAAWSSRPSRSSRSPLAARAARGRRGHSLRVVCLRRSDCHCCSCGSARTRRRPGGSTRTGRRCCRGSWERTGSRS